MNKTIHQTAATFAHTLLNACRAGSLAPLLLLLIMAGVANAQYTSTTDSMTPKGLAPGAPDGSYALSGFDNINLFNGSLNFRLPLLKVGGRGAAGYTITLPIEQKWIIKRGQTNPYTGYTPYVPNPNWWQGIKPGYGPGVLQGRRAGYGDWPTENYCGYVPNVWEQTLTRLTFTTADGTEYELRDQLTGGQPSSVASISCSSQGASRGTVFVTADGSAATFVSDSTIYDYKYKDMSQETKLFYPTGYLTLRDGTRYRIESGQVSWIRDRNGNVLTFGGADGSFVTDSLNRKIYLTSQGSYTDISFGGYGGAARTIRVNYASLGSRLRSGFSLQTYYQLFPLNAASQSTQYNPSRVSSVVLPNNQTYQFYYNQYGELARVELPTGGAIEYDWTGVASETDEVIYRYVIERRLYKSSTTNASLESKTVYTRVLDGTSPVTVQTFDANNSLLSQSKHYFYGDAYQSMEADPSRPAPISYSKWKEGREYQTETFDIVSGTPVLKQRVTQTWAQRAPVSWWTGPADDAPSNDPRLTESVTTLSDTNQVAKQTFGYDQYNNRTDLYEYNYGAGAAPAYPLRHSHTDYLTTNPQNGIDYPNTAHIRDLPTLQQVFSVNPANGAETLASQTQILYDEPGYPVLAYGSLTGWTDPGTAARGLATTISRWLNIPGNFPATHAQYDQAGNPRNSWDARGYLTQTEYGDAYSDSVYRNTYAYPTHTISPAPGSPYGSTTALESTAVYDYSTGLVTSTTDANGQTTSYQFNDPLNRLTSVTRPTGGGSTTYTYSDTIGSIYVATQTTQSATVTQYLYQFYDGLGRSVRSLQYENSDPSNPYLTTDTQYDALGRVWRVSNVYRTYNSTYPVNPSGNWTTTAYDGLGRVKSVTTPDNAVVTTSYSGNQVTVTDQAGKSRRSLTDALGRLIQVIEDPNGLAYQTDYTYDALGNLRQVMQGSQYRYFMYDSLSRLIRAKNPEQDANPALAYTDPTTGNSQWSMAYSYDNNGNLSSRTDARGVTANYVYDSLSRNTEVNYSDGSNVRRYYDSATLGRGRAYYSFRNLANGVSLFSAIDNYDSMGRPTVQRQQFYTGGVWSAPYTVSRVYDWAGHVTSQTYPSGRSVSYTYDWMGRTASFSGNLGDSVSRTYMTALVFDESGRMIREQFGTDTPLYNKRHYNVRGQLYDIRLSSVNDDGNWNRGVIANYYSWTNPGFGASGTDNNGNLYIQQNWIPNDDAISSYSYQQQNYAYDSLNRLSSVGEYPNGSPNTAMQYYSYDRWGNRTISPSSWGVGINTQQFAVDTATNRLNVPAGYSGVMQYDANGNLTNDTYTSFGARTYDAENRMVTATDSSGSQSTYTYNADGQRVIRQTGGQSTWQVYGMEGELVAEYASSASPSTPQKEYGYRNGELLITAEAAPQVNLAVGKSATQISTIEGAVAGRAVDGNTSGQWTSGSVTHTGYQSQGWWEVDLGGVQNINTIKLWNRTDCCQSRLSNFYVLVSNTAFTSTDLTTALSQSGVSSYYTSSMAGASQSISVNRTGRYVRVQLAGWDYLSLAEVEVMGQAAASAAMQWMVTDQLGTPRMIADRSGSLAGIRRHDYLPFGEELFAGTGGRTTAQGYVTDGARQKFTGYERDNETGLDYAQARYYASTQGRFTSPDPLLASGKPTSPQSWNRYAYVHNNPLASVDPDGMLTVPLNDEEQRRQQQQQQQQQQRNIYIFVTFTQAEQQRSIDPDGPQPEFTAVAAPNFQGLVNNAPAGTNVQVITGANATLEAFTNALQDPNAAGVFFIGHGATDDYDPPFTADGINLADGTLRADAPVQVRAQTVGIFACDSQAIRDGFQMGSGQAFIGVNSGRDGLTSTNGLSQAGFSAAQTIIRGGSPDAATAAAHGALTTASSARTFRAPNGQNIDARANPMNAGDRVRRVP